MESFGIDVYDKPIKLGGKQCIRSPEGYVHPLDVVKGLAYTPMRPVTEDDWKELDSAV